MQSKTIAKPLLQKNYQEKLPICKWKLSPQPLLTTTRSSLSIVRGHQYINSVWHETRRHETFPSTTTMMTSIFLTAHEPSMYSIFQQILSRATSPTYQVHETEFYLAFASSRAHTTKNYNLTISVVIRFAYKSASYSYGILALAKDWRRRPHQPADISQQPITTRGAPSNW